MKKHFPLALVSLLLLASVCLAQKGATTNPLEKTLADRENKLWEAFKNKQSGPFQDALSNDTVLVGDPGLSSKPDILKFISSGICTIEEFALSDFKVSMIYKDVALITYKGTQKGSCDGKPLPTNVLASSIWARRGNRWWAVFHQESPMQ
jgi:hypothetical protein